MGIYGEPCPKPSFAKDKRQAKRDKERAWQATRRLVLARDKHQCRVCGSRESIDVHHLRFRSVGGDVFATSNTACLCRVCHGAVHAYRLAIEGDADKRLTVTWL